ncbi:MAG: TetR/AcrR family transcriptional regulator, partial [Actinomycetota bacterium]
MPTTRADSRSATRQRIFDAAKTAFAAKGFDGTGLVADILEPAGVSSGSFYHQFDDKLDLLVQLLSDAAERAEAASAERGAPQKVPTTGLDYLEFAR